MDDARYARITALRQQLDDTRFELGAARCELLRLQERYWRGHRCDLESLCASAADEAALRIAIERRLATMADIRQQINALYAEWEAIKAARGKRP